MQLVAKAMVMQNFSDQYFMTGVLVSNARHHGTSGLLSDYINHWAKSEYWQSRFCVLVVEELVSWRI